MNEVEKMVLIKSIIFKPSVTYSQITNEDIEAAVKFFSCNREPMGEDEDIPPEKQLDYMVDNQAIHQAFFQVYGIDLCECEYMHWWKFGSLLTGCMNDTPLANIVQLRETSISEMISSKRIKEGSPEHRKLSAAKSKVFIGWNKRGDM